ncbi:hypothetical protein SDC9_97954 [bioreactor metagenome]|uniref:Uncharacterized protein n=1 Tax=bioreactor metagenome TaxID=1076179 RepID=A0A645ADV0_9ZZZZ
MVFAEGTILGSAVIMPLTSVHISRTLASDAAANKEAV